LVIIGSFNLVLDEEEEEEEEGLKG